MNIEFIKLSPTQNVTVLVKTPVPRPRQAEVAAKLLACDGVGGEQAGFIEQPADPSVRARLQMMGGEFCGNATMALGAVLAREAGLAGGEYMDMRLEVSGSDAPVSCRIRRTDGAWEGTVRMPLPTGIGTFDLETDGGRLSIPLVRMPGIAHLILPAEAGLDEAQLRRRLPEWCRQTGAEALGALTWDAAASAIDPLVYVPSAGTLVREHGCGSGTAAVGCWQAAKAGTSYEAAVRQPGGVITVRTAFAGGAVAELSITGAVRIVAEGTAYIEE